MTGYKQKKNSLSWKCTCNEKCYFCQFFSLRCQPVYRFFLAVASNVLMYTRVYTYRICKYIKQRERGKKRYIWMNITNMRCTHIELFALLFYIYCCVKFDARANALHARIRWKTRAIWKCKEMLTRQMIYSIGAAPIHNARGCDLFYPLRATDAKSIHTAAPCRLAAPLCIRFVQVQFDG